MKKWRSANNLIFSFVLLATFCVEGHCVNLLNIRAQIRRHIRDTSTIEALRRYSDSDLNNFANEAHREVVNITWPLVARSSFTLVAGTTYYSCPTDMIVPKSAYYTNARNITTELREELEQSYRKNNPDYERQSGTPSSYFVRTSTYGATAQDISFVPVPTSASTGTVNLDYYQHPSDLTDDADIPFNGDANLRPYTDIIIYRVVAHIKLIEGEIDQATNYFSLYKNQLDLMSSRLGRAPNYSPGIIGGGISGSSGSRR